MSKIYTNGVHIEISGLSRSFHGRPVLKNLNLNVEPSEFTVVIGRSGCGKSTLLKLIAGLDRPTAGQLFLDHAPAIPLDPRLRIVFQEARLLPWKSVFKNITLGATEPNVVKRARELLVQVGLLDFSHQWPAVLSGGQQQRVALARALITRPRLLLFDEPLGALDALTRLEMQDLLERLWLEEKFTALLITHDVEEAVALADRIILIEDAQITLNATVDLPRPRVRDSAGFTAIRHEVLARIKTRS
jgi:sulfonate transport system ATP-binding protein